MLPNILLPDSIQLQLESLDIDETNHSLTLFLATTAAQAACPACGEFSTRIHSRYTRILADLPWADWPVCLQLHVRKFRCLNNDCSRSIFTERLPTIAVPWARRTKRLASAQQHIGLTAGGQAGTRLATTLTMPIGPDTLLALVRKTLLPPPAPPTVVGIDDWARRKGQTYGTILVDLTSRRPIDLLSERSTSQVAQWLRCHPDVAIISRDRSGIYAEAATQAAPNAIQVADRWHILKNLGEAVLRVLQQHHGAIEQSLTASSFSVPAQSSFQAVTASTAIEQMTSALTRREQERVARQAAKHKRHANVQQLAQQGWTLRAIAAQTGLDRKTVRKYIQLSHLPPAQPRGQGTSLLDAFKPYILERWQAGCRNAMQILREIQPLGYRGQRSIVRSYLTQLRKMHGLPARSRSAVDTTMAPRKPTSLRTLTWLILRRPEKRTPEEQVDLECICTAHADIERAVSLAQAFATLVRTRQDDAFDDWLERAKQSGLAPLRSFAKGLLQDEVAVRAGISLPWSQGPVEGHINRLKLLKRQSYGRAGLDLLRIRLLAA